MIRFLIKLSFFLFVVFVIVSLFVERPSSNHFSSPRESTTTSDVIIALKETLNDLGTFCDRNVESCKIGRSFLSSLSERAYYGARVAYEYLGRILSNKNMEESQNVTPNTGTQEPVQKHTTLP
ncbi:DUF5330 domain-containing protein [Bartonella rattaustraliani]|uniref:DUF5330 domain-containing protein n=1 Tax=Bartonella rattaustraliani TaxID=481139 RepID=UPI0002D2AE83|nr:DUF5330 domain-containing protein [Bartonella rattaustraliani]